MTLTDTSPPAGKVHRRVRIEVRAEEIRAGWRGDDTHCPVAFAINRKLRRPHFAKVHCDGANIWERNYYDRPYSRHRLSASIDLDDEVLEWILRFDAYDHTLKPFNFTISIPKEILDD